MTSLISRVWPFLTYAIGWLVVFLGLKFFRDSISVCIKPSPRERETVKR